MNLVGLVAEPKDGSCQPLLRSLGDQSNMAIDVVSQVVKGDVQTIFMKKRITGRQLSDDGAFPDQELTVGGCVSTCHIGKRTLQQGHQPEDVAWHQPCQQN